MTKPLDTVEEKINCKIVLCWLTGLRDSYQVGMKTSGHLFEDFGYNKTKDKTIVYSKCVRCGLISFAWYSGHQFDLKIKGLKNFSHPSDKLKGRKK